VPDPDQGPGAKTSAGPFCGGKRLFTMRLKTSRKKLQAGGNGVRALEGKKLAAVLLILLGVLIIAGQLGFLSSLMGFLVPILIILLGVVAWRNGNRAAGAVVGAVGGFMLLGKLWGLLLWSAASAAIVVGISWLRGNSAPRW